MTSHESRRSFLTVAGASAALAASQPTARAEAKTAAPPKQDDEDVGAVEDLMREHGVIRRVLVVYRETASRLRLAPKLVPTDSLHRAATLMQTFGEDYHERALEETHLFPAVKKAGGAAASLVEPLLAQHQRGREITRYISSVSKRAMSAAHVEPLARALESFARMYEMHAAQEDTVVFQAWREALSQKQRAEMGELFEDIEHKTFGKDGFDDACDKIAAIERELGITLAGMLAPAPPAAP